MQKKNLFLRMAAVLAVTALFATCLVSGTTTLAKYTSTATGSGSAQVAKWSIFVTGASINAIADARTGGTQIAEKSAVTLDVNLFDEILCEGLAAPAGPASPDLATAADTHVSQPGGNARVAPGTHGNLAAIKIWNDSEVHAKYEVTITLADGANGGIGPLEFFNGTSWVNWATFAGAGKNVVTLNNSGAGYAPGADAVIAATDFQWRWNFEKFDGPGSPNAANDIVDTGLGIDARTSAAAVTATISIKAIQVD